MTDTQAKVEAEVKAAPPVDKGAALKAAIAERNKAPTELAREDRDKKYPPNVNSIEAAEDPTAADAEKNMAEATGTHCYKLSSGATRYVTAKGKVIYAAGCVLTAWDEEDEAEFEANVRCGIWTKIERKNIAQAVDRQKNSSIIAQGTSR